MFETTNQFIEFLPHPFGQLGLLFPIHGKSKKNMFQTTNQTLLCEELGGFKSYSSWLFGGLKKTGTPTSAHIHG
jgi:hypothetical protein